jgi:hypothetical protein
MANNFFVAAYGAIYVEDGAVAQSFTATTPAKLTLFASNGISLNMIPDHTNDRITVSDTGKYEISGYFSFSLDTNIVQADFHPAVNDVKYNPGAHRYIATGPDVGSLSFSLLRELSANDVVTVIVELDKTADLTVEEGSLVVKRVG